MTVREIIYKVHAEKIHIHDQLSGEDVTIDPLEPASMRTLQRFLHLQVVKLEPAGQDVKMVVTLKVRGG
jgi:hypothetical protein